LHHGAHSSEHHRDRSRAEQSRAEQSRAEQSRAKQSRAEQSRAKQPSPPPCPPPPSTWPEEGPWQSSCAPPPAQQGRTQTGPAAAWRPRHVRPPHVKPWPPAGERSAPGGQPAAPAWQPDPRACSGASSGSSSACQGALWWMALHLKLGFADRWCATLLCVIPPSGVSERPPGGGGGGGGGSAGAGFRDQGGAGMWCRCTPQRCTQPSAHLAASSCFCASASCCRAVLPACSESDSRCVRSRTCRQAHAR
jgi:hypothetical protein